MKNLISKCCCQNHHAKVDLQVLHGSSYFCRAAIGPRFTGAHANLSHPCYLILLREGRKMFVFFCSYPKGSEHNFSLSLWPDMQKFRCMCIWLTLAGMPQSCLFCLQKCKRFLLSTLKRSLRSSFTYVFYFLWFCFSWFILPSHNLPLSPPLTCLPES